MCLFNDIYVTMGKCRDQKIFTGVFILSLILPSLEVLRIDGENVCNGTVPYVYNDLRTFYEIKLETVTSCLPGITFPCIKYTHHRTRIIPKYTIVPVQLFKDGLICCPGWLQQGDTCPLPLCDPTCENGICVAPNECHCVNGFSGGYCNTSISYFN